MQKEVYFTPDLVESVSVEHYKQDVVVRLKRKPRLSAPPKSERGEIMEFSLKSRKRLAFVACNTDEVFTHMITLTYPSDYPSDGATVKKHLRVFLDLVRKGVDDVAYLWFLEFQKRGAPHFHILINARIDYKWVRETWYRIVDSGDYRHLQAGTRTEAMRTKDGAARYACKYAYKMEQKHVPKGYQNVGRFWGHSRNVSPKIRKEERYVQPDRLLEIASENSKARERLEAWIEGRAEPIALLFGCGTEAT